MSPAERADGRVGISAIPIRAMNAFVGKLPLTCPQYSTNMVFTGFHFLPLASQVICVLPVAVLPKSSPSPNHPNIKSTSLHTPGALRECRGNLQKLVNL
jgi:hypothetical protein